ncbi:MAG: polysaccharide biosynthesis tyrosine autokinase [Bacteroidia bacterium]|nr:polysaccharide biosynthesis tyrosine autokinase [Bacteroidia bacterium]
MRFGESFENEVFKFKLILNSKKFNSENISNYDNGFYFLINDLHSIINGYRSKLTIELIDKKATFLVLTSYGEVPKKEVAYLNKLGEVYLRSELEEKNMASINTIKFIDGQLLGIVDSLRNTENILQDFRLNNKAIIDISQEGQMLFEKMEAFQVEKAMLNIKARYYDYLIEYAEQKRVFSDVMAPSAIGIENHVLTSLVEQLLELNTEINVMSYSVKENNPAYNVITVKINSAYEALLENLKNSIKETKLSLDDVDERISILESEINKLPVTERQLINLQRKFKINDQIYTYLLQKRAEAGITQASNIADNKIIDPAMPEDAVIISPEEEKNYMIAIFAGIIIPLLLIFIRYYFNTKITEKKDIESVTNVPVLGIIGHENEQNRLVIAHRPKSMISESFRIFRSNIQYILKDPDKKIISITSPVSGEGKTFIASNLASVIALAGKKTLLVALDMRRPQIHYELEMENHIGISSYLIAKTSYEEIVTKTHIDNLYLVAAGPIPPNPSELIETERMKQFINKAKEKFDYIIIDTPPIALVADALLISKYTDANIFVIRHNYTRKSMLGIINELYEKQKLNGMGIVLNDLFRKRMNEYYGYGHYNYGYAGYRYGYGKRNEYYYYDDEKPVNGIIGKIINSVFSKIKSRL